MKKILVVLSTFFLFFILANPLLAQSSYVLPYPSFMPGNPFYKPHLLWEKVMKYWYFGNFAQFKYTLKQSDKYLVEAKTLFEYKQYFLGISALKKSDEYFAKIPLFLMKAKLEKKDIGEKEIILSQAADKHQEVLKKLIRDLPEEFHWQPEKEEETLIKIKESLEEAVKIRIEFAQ